MTSCNWKSVPRKHLILFLFLLAFGMSAPAYARSVLYISIDGMNPEYVTEADARGLKVPNLRRFLTEGSYATGVTGVVPTVSWPSAATLMTGVETMRHGVLNNRHFLAPDLNKEGSIYFYASDIKVDTLWDAANRSGIVTANVDQLGSVGNPAVHYDIPRYEPSSIWSENLKAIRATARPASLMPELESKLGTYAGVDFQNPDYDRSRAEFAIEIMRRYKPQFMTLHLSGVDVNAHAHGPFSPQANSAVEYVDVLIGELHVAALELDPEALVVVVSDHGQAPATRILNLRIPFVAAGLIEIEKPVPGRPVRVTGWEADVWSAAGAAIMLKDPADTQVRAKVAQVLRDVAADPANGISRVIEGDELKKLGGFPGASFVVDMKSGTVIGNDLLGDVLVESSDTFGVHGYLPDNPRMNASFFIVGKGVEAGRNLGQIDMRRIAPTVAQALGVKLIDAMEPALPVFEGVE